jgi:hypothetical protein
MAYLVYFLCTGALYAFNDISIADEKKRGQMSQSLGIVEMVSRSCVASHVKYS